MDKIVDLSHFNSVTIILIVLVVVGYFVVKGGLIGKIGKSSGGRGGGRVNSYRSHKASSYRRGRR